MTKRTKNELPIVHCISIEKLAEQIADQDFDDIICLLEELDKLMLDYWTDVPFGRKASNDWPTMLSEWAKTKVKDDD